MRKVEKKLRKVGDGVNLLGDGGDLFDDGVDLLGDGGDLLGKIVINIIRPSFNTTWLLKLNRSHLQVVE